MTELEIKCGGKNEGVLKRFMQEFFPYSEFKNIGFFTEEMKNNYYLQAVRVCKYFGFDSIYEYGSKEIKGHITYVDGKRPKDEGFISVFKSIYE